MTAIVARLRYVPGPGDPPKHVLVNGHKIHLRLLQNVLWLIAAGFAALLIISGLYLVVFQIDWHWFFTFPSLFGHRWFIFGHHFHLQGPNLKHWWDNLFHKRWWREVRHGSRNAYEGVAALPLLKWAAFAGKRYWAEHVSGWSVVWRLPAALIAGAAGILAGLWVVVYGFAMLTQWKLHVAYTAPSDKVQELLFAVLGLVVAQATTRIWRPAASYIQGYWADQLAGLRTWAYGTPFAVRYPVLPPAMRERAQWLHDQGVLPQHRASWLKVAAPALLLAGIGLLITGLHARYGVPWK